MTRPIWESDIMSDANSESERAIRERKAAQSIRPQDIAAATVTMAQVMHGREGALDLQWQRMTGMTHDLVTDSVRRIDETAQYQLMFNELRNDRVIQGKTVLGLRRAPASKDRHHAHEGGLVFHMLEMYEAWKVLRPLISVHANGAMQFFSDRLVWRAIVHHDLNKVHKYVLESIEPWTVSYANELDRTESLLGSAHKSISILNRYNISLPVVLHNALVCSEGGYSETRPHAETVFAKVIYILDELSANVIYRLQHDKFWDSKFGGPFENP